nr:MAG TPA: hypothetical protein [Caudoviricetes sp.]
MYQKHLSNTILLISPNFLYTLQNQQPCQDLYTSTCRMALLNYLKNNHHILNQVLLCLFLYPNKVH